MARMGQEKCNSGRRKDADDAAGLHSSARGAADSWARPLNLTSRGAMCTNSTQLLLLLERKDAGLDTERLGDFLRLPIVRRPWRWP